MISAPLTVSLEITDKCNYRCPHCYRLDNNDGLIPRTVFKEKDEIVFEIAKKLVDARIFSIILTGGEPLLNKTLTAKLVEYFKSSNICVSLNTNLVLLDDAFLKEIMNIKLDSILVSCPASNPEIYRRMTGNGDFSKFEVTLKKIVASGMHCIVNMVVNKINLRFVRETATKMANIGVKKFGVTPMALNVLHPEENLFLDKNEVVWLINDLLWIKKSLGISVDILEALPKCIFPEKIRESGLNFLQRKCQAGITTMAVSDNGDVRPCTHNPDVYGNLFKEPLSSIWEKMSGWRSGLYIPGECKNCKVLNKCLGGCRMTARAFSGKEQGKDPWMTELLLEDNFKQWPVVFSLDKDSIIYFAESFKWRREGDDYLICTKTPNNILRVNDELFRLVNYLWKTGKIRLNDLAVMNNLLFDDVNFQKIIKLLLRKKFIFSTR